MTPRIGLTADAVGPRKVIRRAKARSSNRFRVAALVGVAGFVLLLALAFAPLQTTTATPTREGTCDSCHPTGAEGLLIVTGLPATYDPSVTYTITITVADTNGATGENSFSMDVTGGVMNLAMQTDTNVEINTVNVRASANDGVSPMSVSSWQVKWTAPSSGQVTFTVNAVSANDVDNGNNAPTDSDQIVVDATAIPEFPTLIIPIFAVVGAVLIAARAAKRQ